MDPVIEQLIWSMLGGGQDQLGSEDDLFKGLGYREDAIADVFKLAGIYPEDLLGQPDPPERPDPTMAPILPEFTPYESDLLGSYAGNPIISEAIQGMQATGDDPITAARAIQDRYMNATPEEQAQLAAFLPQNEHQDDVDWSQVSSLLSSVGPELQKEERNQADYDRLMSQYDQENAVYQGQVDEYNRYYTDQPVSEVLFGGDPRAAREGFASELRDEAGFKRYDGSAFGGASGDILEEIANMAFTQAGEQFVPSQFSQDNEQRLALAYALINGDPAALQEALSAPGAAAPEINPEFFQWSEDRMREAADRDTLARKRAAERGPDHLTGAFSGATLAARNDAPERIVSPNNGVDERVQGLMPANYGSAQYFRSRGAGPDYGIAQALGSSSSLRNRAEPVSRSSGRTPSRRSEPTRPRPQAQQPSSVSRRVERENDRLNDRMQDFVKRIIASRQRSNSGMTRQKANSIR